MPSTDRRYGLTGGIALKAPCRVATTANITLSGLQAIDGVTVVEDDRVLVKNQSDATQNGIWNATTGTWTRAVDFNGRRDAVQGTLVLVIEGTSNQSTVWQLTTPSPSIGSESLAFAATSAAALGVASAWIIANLLPASSAAAARTALGAAADAALTQEIADRVADIAALQAELDATPRATTGDIKLTWKTVADSGWIMHDDGTIGDADSSATTRANADCANLFAAIWGAFDDTKAPVSGGRGASAALDFAAHKTIGLPKALGYTVGVAGAGSGLTSRALGDLVGEETHMLTDAENTVQAAGTSGSGGGSGVPAFAVDSTPAEFNVMQPTTFWNVMVKL